MYLGFAWTCVCANEYIKKHSDIYIFLAETNVNFSSRLLKINETEGSCVEREKYCRDTKIKQFFVTVVLSPQIFRKRKFSNPTHSIFTK